MGGTKYHRMTQEAYLDNQIIKQFHVATRNLQLKLDDSVKYKGHEQQLQERIDLTLMRYFRTAQLKYVYPITMQSFRLINYQDKPDGVHVHYHGNYRCGSHPITLDMNLHLIEKHVVNYGDTIELHDCQITKIETERPLMQPNAKINVEAIKQRIRTQQSLHNTPPYSAGPTYGGAIFNPFNRAKHPQYFKN